MATRSWWGASAGVSPALGAGFRQELMSGGSVLIVEDDSDIREALTQILEEEGYAVDSAPNGKAGLHRLITEAYVEKRPVAKKMLANFPVGEQLACRAGLEEALWEEALWLGVDVLAALN